MKFWLVLVALIVVPACSGTRQDQRDGDTSNQFSEHHGMSRADAHVNKTSAPSGGEQDGWVSTILGGVWDILFNSDSSDSSGF